MRRLNRRLGELFRGLAALAVLATAGQGAEPAYDGELTAAGQWLAKAVDQLDVEHLWLKGQDHVAWRSGLPLLEEHGKRLTPLAADETHCSAFAAAAADSLRIYLLHPPEHSHVLLANAQFDWLPSPEGRQAGWRAVASPLEAQQLANQGELVIAVFKNPDGTQSGHIAIVRPDAKPAAAIEARGPQITQAGFTNYRSTDLATGFDHHPGAWEPGGRGGVRFYAHAVDAAKLAGE